ncbi:MAG: hypothetical protein ACFE9Z_01210 [Promethearchaeota archaeon]
MGPSIAEKHLDKLIEGKLIEMLDDKLVLNPKGLKIFYKAKEKEFRERAYNINLGVSRFRWQNLICIFFVIIFIVIIILSPQINSWFASL